MLYDRFGVGELRQQLRRNKGTDLDLADTGGMLSLEPSDLLFGRHDVGDALEPVAEPDFADKGMLAHPLLQARGACAEGKARPDAWSAQPASHDVLGCQCADLIRIGELDLERCMLDAEAVMQLLRDAVEDGIAGVAARDDQMTGQRRLRGAHPPDVEIVQPADAGQRQQVRAYRGDVDPFRNRAEGEADGALYQAPGPDDDDDRNGEADGGVEPCSAGGPDRDADGRDTRGNEGIRRHVQERALDVQLVGMAGGEQQRSYAIDENPCRGHHYHNAAGDWRRMSNPPDGLPGD